MLNTVMALWNQHPGENRQRVVKLLFTFLFISVSIFLLLFTLNSSAWSSVPAKEQIQTEKGGQVGMNKHGRMATTGTTPIGYGVVPATPAATRIPLQVCVRTPTVVVQPSTVPQVKPQKTVIYARNSSLEHKSSKSHQVHSMTVHVRKSRPHLKKKPPIKVIATPIPHEIIILRPPPSSVPATPQPTVTPVVTASVTETPVLAEATVVSSMPDVVVMNTTPDTSMTSTNYFVHSLRKKGVMRIPVSPAAKSTSENSDKKSDPVRDAVECSRSTTHKDASGGALLRAKGRRGLLLGSSLLGAVLFCCFMFARRREK